MMDNLFNELVALGEKKSGSLANQEARRAIISRLAAISPNLHITEERFPLQLVNENRAFLVAGFHELPYRFYLNMESVMPTHGGWLKCWFYADHSSVRNSFSKVKLIKRGIIPIPMSLFYRFSAFFPSDIDPLHKRSIPALSTFCANPLYHTAFDDGRNIIWSRYDTYKKLILDLICSVAAAQ